MASTADVLVGKLVGGANLLDRDVGKADLDRLLGNRPQRLDDVHQLLVLDQILFVARDRKIAGLGKSDVGMPQVKVGRL